MPRTACHPEAPHRCVVEWTSARSLHGGRCASYWRSLLVTPAWLAADLPSGTGIPQLDRNRPWQSQAVASAYALEPADSSPFSLRPPETRRVGPLVAAPEHPPPLSLPKKGWVPHISLVFREIGDCTAPSL